MKLLPDLAVADLDMAINRGLVLPLCGLGFDEVGPVHHITSALSSYRLGRFFCIGGDERI